MADRAADLLSRYAAQSVRLSSGGSASGAGGGLAAAIDRLGVQSLALVLLEGETVELGDPGVSLQVCREGPGDAVMRVSWEHGPTYQEHLLLRAGSAKGLAAAPVVHAAPTPAPAPVRGPRLTDLVSALAELDRPLWADTTGVFSAGPGMEGVGTLIPSMTTKSMGSPEFRAAHGVRAAYVAGAMAGGISSEDLVIAMGREGLLACFGSGGLDLDRVEQAVVRILGELPEGPCGFNLLHNPAEPRMEERTVDLYLEHGVRTVSASAYMRLTPAVLRFRLTGIREEGGRVLTDQRVLAKVSRPEVAEQFMRPASTSLLRELVAKGAITQHQAALAEQIPVAEDITVEGDSGGHTDRRPLIALLPVIRRLRDRVAAEQGYAARGVVPRVGAAGGLGDPSSVYGAFAMGADYVLTGSVNQCCRESGTSELAREMLAQAGIADCTTGPAPDMFELGAQVQVLGRGSMWAQRGQRLYVLWRDYKSLDDIPADVRAKLERQVFRRSLADVWTDTAAFWRQRDPRELERAQADPHHQMALVFRWYLGMSSRWARTGDAKRKRDYQIWCGPAMGLFNDWVAGSWLEPLSARGVVAVADALLRGAAVLARTQVLRSLGLTVPTELDPPGPTEPVA